MFFVLYIPRGGNEKEGVVILGYLWCVAISFYLGQFFLWFWLGRIGLVGSGRVALIGWVRYI